MKKFSVLTVAIALIFSLMPFCSVSLANEGDYVYDTSDDTTIRYKSNILANTDGTLIVDGSESISDRFALLKFDTSADKDVLSNAKKVEFFFRTSSVAKDGSIVIYNVSGDGTKSWSENDEKLSGVSQNNIVSFNSTNAIEMTTIALGSLTDNTEYRVDVTNYAKLQDDGILVFKIVGTGTTGTDNEGFTRICSKENSNSHTHPKLIVTPKGEGDGEDAIDRIKVVRNDLSLGDTSCVTNSLDLPSKGFGEYSDVSINWTSSNPSVVSENGVVTVSKINSSMGEYPEKNNGKAVLKAEISKDGISVYKEFKINVPVVGVSPANNATMVWARSFYANSPHNTGNILVLDTWNDYISTGIKNARHIYLGFDLGSQMELFKNAKAVYLRMNARTYGTLNATIEGITSDNGLKGSWSANTLTWNNAGRLIKYKAPEKYTFIINKEASQTHMYDVTPYIRDIDSTLAEFKIRPNENSDFTQYSSSAFQFNASFDGSNSDYVPTLIAVLNEDDSSDFKITANGKEYFYSFPTNEITLKTTVDNSEGKYNNGFTVIYGIYDEYDILTDVVYSPISSVTALKDTVVSTETITLPDKDKSFIKVFVWDGQHNALNKMVTFPN